MKTNNSYPPLEEYIEKALRGALKRGVDGKEVARLIAKQARRIIWEDQTKAVKESLVCRLCGMAGAHFCTGKQPSTTRQKGGWYGDSD